MDNYQLAKDELKAVKVFNPDVIEDVAQRYFLSIKVAFTLWQEARKGTVKNG